MEASKALNQNVWDCKELVKGLQRQAKQNRTFLLFHERIYSALIFTTDENVRLDIGVRVTPGQKDFCDSTDGYLSSDWNRLSLDIFLSSSSSSFCTWSWAINFKRVESGSRMEENR